MRTGRFACIAHRALPESCPDLQLKTCGGCGGHCMLARAQRSPVRGNGAAPCSTLRCITARLQA